MVIPCKVRIYSRHTCTHVIIDMVVFPGVDDATWIVVLHATY